MAPLLLAALLAVPALAAPDSPYALTEVVMALDKELRPEFAAAAVEAERLEALARGYASAPDLGSLAAERAALRAAVEKRSDGLDGAHRRLHLAREFLRAGRHGHVILRVAIPDGDEKARLASQWSEKAETLMDQLNPVEGRLRDALKLDEELHAAAFERARRRRHLSVLALLLLALTAVVVRRALRLRRSGGVALR